MPVLTAPVRDCDFIVSEARGDRSFEKGALAVGQNLAAGAVLGRITASGAYTAFAPAATDGSQTAAGILYASTDATSAAKNVTVLVRQAEVNGKVLVWPAGVTTAQKDAAQASLLAAGLLIRPDA